jgi:hypothetical protein
MEIVDATLVVRDRVNDPLKCGHTNRGKVDQGLKVNGGGSVKVSSNRKRKTCVK